MLSPERHTRARSLGPKRVAASEDRQIVDAGWEKPPSFPRTPSRERHLGALDGREARELPPAASLVPEPAHEYELVEENDFQEGEAEENYQPRKQQYM